MTGFTPTESADGSLVAAPSHCDQLRSQCTTSLWTARLWRGRLMGSVLAVTSWVGQAVGQESSGGGVRVETSGRSFTVEALVVAVSLGLALFSVCRSSRRV
jgi:hypothetical protein